MKSLRIYITGLVVFTLLGGCGLSPAQPAQQPAVPPSNTNTLTVAQPGATATSTTTLVPTRRATVFFVPTITPVPAIPLPATFTPPSTRGVPTLLPFPTVLWTVTPTSYACSAQTTYPDWGQVFKPRTDFVAIWQITNTGASMWHVGDMLFGFVSGVKMQNPDRGTTYLPVTIYVKDHITEQVHMVPPKAPGTYDATWGIRKSNKTEPFCTFTIHIVVAK